jgi:hypothetical protein
MKLPLHIAKKLQQLLLPGKTVASSTMQHGTVTKMLEDGLLQKQQLSKTKALLFISKKEDVIPYLQNHFAINNLDEYIQVLENDEASRADNIIVAGNSKIQAVRTFKGFLVNCYEEINATINGEPVVIKPLTGAYTFIHSYENFIPEAAVTIVGIENPENFMAIEKQRYLFTDIKPLFVSRYPQSGDLIKWLLSISNQYLHFGDLDFAGISIYQNEFKKRLLQRASFFVPDNAEALLQQFGNRELFNRQYNLSSDYLWLEETSMQELFGWIMKYKKVLEQEVFINSDQAKQ